MSVNASWVSVADNGCIISFYIISDGYLDKNDNIPGEQEDNGHCEELVKNIILSLFSRSVFAR